MGDWRPEKNLSDVASNLDLTHAEISFLINSNDLKQILTLIGRLKVDDYQVFSISYYPREQATNVIAILRIHRVELARVQGTNWQINKVSGVVH
jgi:hypothetical protein